MLSLYKACPSVGPGLDFLIGDNDCSLADLAFDAPAADARGLDSVPAVLDKESVLDAEENLPARALDVAGNIALPVIRLPPRCVYFSVTVVTLLRDDRRRLARIQACAYGHQQNRWHQEKQPWKAR